MLRLEGPGAEVLYQLPFASALGKRPFHPELIVSHSESFAVAFYPVAEGIQGDRIPAALAPVQAITAETHRLLSELPKTVRELLGLPSSDNWWRVVFHLAWHFSYPFLGARRYRLLAENGVPRGRIEDTFAQMYGTAGSQDLLPGLIYSELEHDLCTCSEAAVGAIIEALERNSQVGPSAHKAQDLSPDQRRLFDRLRTEFLAGMQLPPGSLECKLLKLANSFEIPPASEWAGLTMGGGVERFLTLSRLNELQEIIHIRGPATDWFCELAERAGAALPSGIPDYPILFDDIRRNECGIPIGIRGPYPVLNRGALERWIGFVFATLKQHEHEALRVRWGTTMGPLSYGFATLDRDLCAVSVLAIDLARLTTPLPPVPTDAVQASEVRTVDPTSLIATLRDWAAREYSASKGTFWLAAYPDGLQLGRCNRHDPACGAVVEGQLVLPWGGLHALGSMNLGEHGPFNLLAFSLLHSSTEEMDRFLSFAADAAAALIAHPPSWGKAIRRAADPATTWLVSLMFLCPASAAYAVEHPGGCRLITQPWAASVAALREWGTIALDPDDSGDTDDRPARLEGEQKPLPPARHSADFRWVHWYGTDYTFTKTQAACVKVLWEEMENGTPELDQQTILSAVDSESQRLVDLFKGHPAWKTLIVAGTTTGAFRLANPEQKT